MDDQVIDQQSKNFKISYYNQVWTQDLLKGVLSFLRGKMEM